MNSATILRRLDHVAFTRHFYWDGMSDAARRGLNKAVDSCMKDALDAGLILQARQVMLEAEKPGAFWR